MDKYHYKQAIVDENKYTKNYAFNLKEGWDGQGFVTLSQGIQFNSFNTSYFQNGMILNDIAILYNNDLEMDKETIDIIKLLIKKSKRNKVKKKRTLNKRS